MTDQNSTLNLERIHDTLENVKERRHTDLGAAFAQAALPQPWPVTPDESVFVNENLHQRLEWLGAHIKSVRQDHLGTTAVDLDENVVVGNGGDKGAPCNR